jgi:miniconductance mechanosensitive channel
MSKFVTNSNEILMVFSNDPSIILKELFVNAGLSYGIASILSAISLVMIVLVISWLANVMAKFIILRIVTAAVRKSKTQWDDIFLEQKVFTRLSHLAPALIIWFMSAWALKDYQVWLLVVHKMTYIYLILVGTFIINSFIESWHQIYLTLPISKHRHIKGYVQLVKILVILITVLITVSVIFKKDISSIVTGVGAMAAVVMLVFKDTLLGFVASIQLSSNKMLKEGDWVTIPARGIDGTVSDISLNTVKVKNFDNTIITVPTWALIQESFQNWVGMEESDGRRVKKAIHIDLKSIRFIDKPLRDKLYEIKLLRQYIDTKEVEVKNSDQENITAETNVLNGQRMTNIGLYRAYITAYLMQHPRVNKQMTIYVRHNAPTDNGLPLEVSFFIIDKDGKNYEMVQSDIFDHLIAGTNEFDLKLFQHPTGDDFRQMKVN